MSVDVKEALKAPWVKYTVFGIGVIGLAFIVARRAGSSGSVVASDPNADALAATYAQLQQSAASQQSAQSYDLAKTGTLANAQLAALKLATDSDVTKTLNSNAAQINIASIAAGAQNHAADMAAQTQISLAGIQEHAAATQAASIVALGNIQATNTAQIAMAADKATTDQAALLATTQQRIAELSAGVAVTQSNNSANVAINDSNNNANVGIAQSNNNAAVGIAQSHDSVAVAQAYADAQKAASGDAKSAANTNSWLSTAASVAGIVAAFFA